MSQSSCTVHCLWQSVDNLVWINQCPSWTITWHRIPCVDILYGPREWLGFIHLFNVRFTNASVTHGTVCVCDRCVGFLPGTGCIRYVQESTSLLQASPQGPPDISPFCCSPELAHLIQLVMGLMLSWLRCASSGTVQGMERPGGPWGGVWQGLSYTRASQTRSGVSPGWMF
jgi:hypothetical protein